MLDDVQLKGYSQRTQEAYCKAVRQVAVHFRHISIQQHARANGNVGTLRAWKEEPLPLAPLRIAKQCPLPEGQCPHGLAAGQLEKQRTEATGHQRHGIALEHGAEAAPCDHECRANGPRPHDPILLTSWRSLAARSAAVGCSAGLGAMAPAFSIWHRG